MATGIDILDQLLSTSSNLGLSDWQQQQLRIQAETLRNNTINAVNTPASHVPRSMSAYNMPISTQLPTADTMDRTRSAPAPATTTMSRSASHFAHYGNNGFDAADMGQRSLSSLPAYPAQDDDEASSYVYTQSAPIRKRASLQPINEMSTLGNGNVTEWEPEDFIAQLTPDMQWCPPLDGSISPSTPSVGAMTPATIASSSMSRQASSNPQFLNDVSMLRVQSNSSFSLPPILPEDGSFSFSSSDVDPSTISASVDMYSLFPSSSSTFAGCSANEAVFPFSFSSSSSSPSAHFAPSTSTLGHPSHQSSLQQRQTLDLAEDMRRSASTSSSESDASHGSTAYSQNNISSRHSRRASEINAYASRKIAPKQSTTTMSSPSQNQAARSASASTSSGTATPASAFNVQMKRVVSADGSSKDVAPISKAPYIRPTHPKITCPHCNARPEGFRGTHELERHVARAHATVRKGYVCVDASEDKKFLASCKHCKKGKVYGAYYNAAAHLRRAHFHPRKRGRKGKGVEKRGGIGGGDDPPMEVLKAHWIRETEVVGGEKQVKREQKAAQASAAVAPLAAAAPASMSTGAVAVPVEAATTQPERLVDYASYPATGMPDMSAMQLDFNNQFMDQTVFMSAGVNDGAYDPSLEYYNASSDGMEDFQFEACQYETY